MAHEVTIKDGNIKSVFTKNGKTMELNTTVAGLEGDPKRKDNQNRPDHWKAIKRRQAYAVIELLYLTADDFFKICEEFIKDRGKFNPDEKRIKEIAAVVGEDYPNSLLGNPHTWCLIHSCFVRTTSLALQGEVNEKICEFTKLLDKRHPVGYYKRYKKALRHIHLNVPLLHMNDVKNEEFSMPTLEEMREGFEINKFEREPLPSNVVVN